MFGLVWLLASPVAAQEVDEERDAQARIHFQAGANYFETGDYAQAAREFERSYALSGRPSLLYNMYTAYERLGELESAAASLERYLAEVPDVDNADALRQRLARVRERIAAESAAASPPEGAPAEMEPPREDVREESPAVRQEEGSAVPLPAVVSFVVGAVGLATFTTFAILGAVEDASLAERCLVEGRPACSDADVSTLHTFNTVADVGLVVGVLAVSTGAVLWMTAGEDAEHPVAAALTPWVGPRSAGISAAGAF